MPDDRQSPPAIDAVALAHILVRLAGAAAAPWLHQEVARRMAQRLPLIREAPGAWVDWWGHLGGSAEAVNSVLPRALRQVVEPTPALVELSRRRLRRPWWSFGQRPASQVCLAAEVPPGQAQMVWANMMLHVSPNPPATVAGWHAALGVGGFLMFSMLGPDSLRELRQVYAEHGWPAPHPPFADMHDIGDLLVTSGFADPVMDQELIRLNWSSPQALLIELRAMGGHLGPARFPGLRTARWRERLLMALQQRADSQGRIHLSFELVYGHAFKAPPKPGRGEPATVSLESLRGSLRNRRASLDGQ